MKIFRRWRALSWRKFRQGWREGGGAREFLRAMRTDLFLWLILILAIALQAWLAVSVIALCAMVTAAFREWNLRAYRKMLDGYGAMVDHQQGIIGVYQTDHMHPSEKLAKARARRMN